MEKRIRDKADQWLALRESGKGIRESFGETGMAYVQWLLIPGSPESGEIPDELVSRWNALLLQVFARTDRYRKPEEELWEDLRRILQDWNTWEETENDVSQIFLENWAVPRTSHFVGREEELARMRKCLSEAKILILFGMAGMGKSSLAKEYASRFQRAYDRAVLLPCERGIRDALADDSILPVRGLCYVPQGKRGELGWYCRKKLNRLREIITERTLLILDNLDDLVDSYFFTDMSASMPDPGDYQDEAGDAWNSCHGGRGAEGTGGALGKPGRTNTEAGREGVPTKTFRAVWGQYTSDPEGKPPDAGISGGFGSVSAGNQPDDRSG